MPLINGVSAPTRRMGDSPAAFPSRSGKALAYRSGRSPDWFKMKNVDAESTANRMLTVERRVARVAERSVLDAGVDGVSPREP
jgi:hypothetical protein